MSVVESIKELNPERIVFNVDGGLGRAIAGTAVLQRLKETFPDKDIIVTTGWPQVYEFNPNVYRVFHYHDPLHFYDDYIKKGTFMAAAEPYRNYHYLYDRNHIVDSWCSELGLSRNGALPFIRLLKKELRGPEEYVKKITNNGRKKFVLVQWTGGAVPPDKQPASYYASREAMYKRSLPINVAQKLVNMLVARDYVVGVVQQENHPAIEGAELINFGLRDVFGLLSHTEMFIGIDSFLQHAGAALGIPGVVCWGGTSPKALGYDLHKNISLHDDTEPICRFSGGCHRPNGYVFDNNPSKQQVWSCPDDEACLNYDARFIVEEFEKFHKERTNGRRGKGTKKSVNG